MERVLIVVYVYAPEHSLGDRLRTQVFQKHQAASSPRREEPAEAIWASGQDAFQMFEDVCIYSQDKAIGVLLQNLDEEVVERMVWT